jgi:hypothetical protein
MPSSVWHGQLEQTGGGGTARGTTWKVGMLLGQKWVHTADMAIP